MYKPKSNLLKELYLRGYIHQCTNIEKLDYIAQKKKLFVILDLIAPQKVCILEA